MISIFKILLSIIYRSLFLGDDDWFKHSSLALNVPLIVLIILNATTRHPINLAMSFVSILLIYVLSNRLEIMIYEVILASIPATWLTITAIPFIDDLYILIHIFSRVMVVGIAILTLLFITNPIELSSILSKLGLKSISLIPALMWKVVPHLMKSAEESLLVIKLKKDQIWKGIANTMVAGLEYSEFYDEGLFLKEDIFNPIFKYSPKAIALYIILLVVNLIIYCISTYILII